MGMIPYNKAFTHGGIFHADDVFSSALLRILNPNIVIERGDKAPERYEGLVFDIGGGKYDHHQKDRKIRSNGIPYAAFGLLWQDFGGMLLENEDAQAFDEAFIQPLDQSDNTGAGNILAQCIGDFNPPWNEHTDTDQSFLGAVSLAQMILENQFKSIRAKRDAFCYVRTMIEDGDAPVFIMKEAIPWKEAVIGTGIIYVVFPSVRGGYIVQAVPDDEHGESLKKPFPEEWRGKDIVELKKLSGIETFRFCHMSGFLCVADTEEDAVKIAEMALKEGM